MATIVLRDGKGSPLTNAEVDANFTNLNTAVVDAAVTASWASVSGKPATLAGYGITDAQALDADLTAIAALAGTTGFLKKTAANTWALDTSTYLTGITSGQVTTALGFTPYNATNPAGYTTNTGTVTSVAVSVPTGLSVTGSPITTSGSIAISLAAGYSIPTTAKQTTWDTASSERRQWDGDSTNLVAATARTSLGLVIGTNVQAWDADLDAIAALSATTGFLKKTAANTWALDTATYLTGNQSISYTGDATGSGTTSVALTLANSGVTAGTYPKVTVDAKGRVTAGAALVAGDVPTLNQSTTGNAATATVLQTARTINGVSFNGSANVTVTTAGTGVGVSGTAVSIAAAYSPNTSTELATAVDLNTLQTAGFYYQTANADAAAGFNYPIAQAGSLFIQKSAGVTQQYQTYGTTDTELYFRSVYSSVWGGWRRVLTSSNYNNFSPTLLGTGASGTWGISITGNAATASTLQTARNIALTGDVTGTASFNGSANASIAGTLANSGVTAGTYTKVTVDAKGRVTTGASLVSADLPTYTGSITSAQVTAALSFTPYNATNPSGYITSSASITGNAATATALQTARTINGVSFNGSANITIADATKLPLAGGTATGNINATSFGVSNNSNTTGLGISLYAGGSVGQPTYGLMFAGTPTFGTYGPVTNDWATYFTMNNTAGRGWIFKTSTGTAGNVASISVSGAAQFASTVTAPTFSGALSGNATTATTLQTARTINGVSFNGSANINIAITDPTMLPLAGGTMTGKLVTSGNGGARLFESLATSYSNVPMFYVEHSFTTVVIGNARAGDINLKTVSGNVQVNFNTVLHSGNYSSYALPLSGGTITTSGSTSSLTISDTGASGANIRLLGNGATTPNKTIRAQSGLFQVINNAYTAPCMTVDDAGNLTANANVFTYSDERLKKDWAPLPINFVECLATLKSGTYTRIDSGERQAGSSAQDWQKLLSEVVASKDETGTLSLAYGNAALVSAIELAKRVVKQSKEIDDLKDRVVKLESLINKLIGDAT